MARAGLQWSLDDLAAAASVSRMSCIRFEGGEKVAAETVAAIQSAFASAGATFVQPKGKLGVTVPD
jgi:DNA-binding XRE family transcriptional regulator